MIYILNRAEKIVGFLQNRTDEKVRNIYFEDLLIEDLTTGSETLELSSLCDSTTSSYLEVGNYIAFKKNNSYKLMQIIETEEEREETLVKKIYCETAGMELINSVYKGAKLNNVNIKRFLESILQDTHWKVGRIDESLTTTLALDLEEKEVYSLIQENISKFNAEIEFRVEIKGSKVAGRYIDVFAKRGKYTGKRLEITKDINKISRKIDISLYATKLIGIGKDNLSFKDIQASDKPLGQNFIVNQKAFETLNNKGSHITKTFEYDTTDPNELLLQTRKALEQMSKPQVTYEIDCNIVDMDDIEIGDTLIVSDMNFNPPLTIATRVGKLETSRSDRMLNKATLTNFTEIKSGITKYSIGTNDILDGAITQDKIDDMYTQTITTDVLEATKIYTDKLFVDVAKIKDLEAINATIENLTVKDAEIENAVVENLEATNAKIENLKADYAEIDQLIANKAEIKDLEVINANINSLRADKADITQLNAISANINHLQADVAEIDTLLAGNITAENIATGTITAGSGIIAEGAIGDAQISNINANKINAGEIDTSKVKVKGSNGYLFIENNTLYVVDNKKQIRCELGVIENNTNYGFIVRGSDGKTVLIDHNGVHNAGITDGAIDNRKVSENANISGKKLDIDSVIRTINEDGSVTIEGTKIQVGNTTLDVELSKQTNLINEHSTQLSTQQASIKANTEAIKLKVDSQTYTQDKNTMTTQMNKNTSAIDILEKEIDLKVSSTDIEEIVGDVTTTKIDEAVSQINITTNAISQKVSNIETKTNTLEGEVISHETRISNTESKITDSAITNVVKQSQLIKDIEGNIKEVESAVSSVEQTANSITSTVSDLSGKYTEIKQTIDGIDLTGKVSFSDLSTSGKTTIHGANLSTGTVTANKIAAGAITANKIAAGAITANMITTGTLNASKVNVTNLNASNITTGTLSGDRIKGGTLSAANEINFIGGARIFGNAGAYGAGLRTSASEYYFGSGSASFESDVYVKGNLVYHAGNKPTPSAIGALSTSGGTVSGATTFNSTLRTNNVFYGMNNLAIARGSIYIPNFGSYYTWDYIKGGASSIAFADTGVIHFMYNGARSSHLAQGSVYLPHNGNTTCDHFRMGYGIMASPSSGSFHFLSASGNASPLYSGTVYTKSILAANETETITEKSVFDEINNINIISTKDGLRLFNPVETADELDSSPCVVKTQYNKEKEQIETDIDYTSAIATLWKAVQELKQENQELKKCIKEKTKNG